MTRGVLFAPHADDETLFAAFTLIAHAPRVVICYPSTGDYGSTTARLAESAAACAELGAGPVDQWDGVDLEATMRAYDDRFEPIRVWAPDPEASHPDHVRVALAARAVFGDRVTTFHTYVDGVKVRRGRELIGEPGWVEKKLRALACYRSQLQHPRAWRFFLDDLREYLGEPS